MMLHIKLLMVQSLYLLFSIKEAGILEYVIELNIELLIEYISYFVKKTMFLTFIFIIVRKSTLI